MFTNKLKYSITILILISNTYANHNFVNKLLNAAIEQTQHKVTYDAKYAPIDYPNGDIPKNKGVCTDLIIRSYRKLGIDLQKEVHNDMKHHFDLYPTIWGMKKTDTNIDHRRVPNLSKFFERHGTKLPITKNPDDYKAGDIVTWSIFLNNNYIPHIGLVTNQISHSGIPLIVHNYGQGPEIENMLFNFKITGHYRYTGE